MRRVELVTLWCETDTPFLVVVLGGAVCGTRWVHVTWRRVHVARVRVARVHVARVRVARVCVTRVRVARVSVARRVARIHRVRFVGSRSVRWCWSCWFTWEIVKLLLYMECSCIDIVGVI